MLSRLRSRWLLAVLCLVAVAGGALLWHSSRAIPADSRLRAFVYHQPPFPVVFTSRTEPASLWAAAPPGEGFTYPGQRLWQAQEGRLRLLRPDGAVVELTWQRPLPDGSTLIDVMSPSVSLDGRKVLFAGRKGGDDHGHFRLYEVGIDGHGLRALTGGPDDTGCTAVPPMRYAEGGTPTPGANAPGLANTLLPDEERKRVDYDDVDPVDASEGHIAFASTRVPDLGRHHARRASNLWLMKDGKKHPISANRNNDRWPFLLPDGSLIFSMWSRNQEVVAEDLSGIVAYEPGRSYGSAPTNAWMGVALDPNILRLALKLELPVWRERPLFNDRHVFMTALPEGTEPLLLGLGSSPPGGASGFSALALAAVPPQPPARFWLVQTVPPVVTVVPSAGLTGAELPRLKRTPFYVGPTSDLTGKPLSLATPSPCPPDRVLFAAARLEPGAPANYGIYIASQAWNDLGKPAAAAAVQMQVLFDDPDLVDAEPVAVYPRKIGNTWKPTMFTPPEVEKGRVPLADGSLYEGPVGAIEAMALEGQFGVDMIEQSTDIGAQSVFAPPPPGAIQTIVVYASRRDRFDDPLKPRIPGTWDLVARLPVAPGQGLLKAALPTGSPSVLAGLGADGKIVKWTVAAKDAQGRQATFFAYAGDHYTGLRPGQLIQCAGCHPGHSAYTPTQFSEKVK